MGYAHYFDIPTIDELLTGDAERIIEQAEHDGIEIAGPDGESNPVVTEDGIALNGSRALGQSHAPLLLPTLAKASHFCKTERLPYDAVVTAILIAAIMDGNARRVASDGTYADWQDGVALYERAVRKLKQGESQCLRRTLNHEFRPSVSKRLLSDGFAVLLCDIPHGEYTIKDMNDGNSIVATGSADAIVYDAMGWEGTGKCCRSERLADAIRGIVDRKRDSYRHKGGDKAARRDWLDEYVGTSGFNYIDALCF